MQVTITSSHKNIVSYSTHKTQFGVCLVASTEKGICNILFFDKIKDAIADLRLRWPKGVVVHKTLPAHREIERYFQSSKGKTALNENLKQKLNSKIKLHLLGTDFQIRVWKALLSISPGSTKSYGEVAAWLGDKKLSRAVGTAIGNNPIGYIIPCHRVLTSTGGIGGFRWGIDRKRAMLQYEVGHEIKLTNN